MKFVQVFEQKRSGAGSGPRAVIRKNIVLAPGGNLNLIKAPLSLAPQHCFETLIMVIKIVQCEAVCMTRR